MTSPVPKTAMVLAAGKGTRLRPITDTLPKPLVKIEGRSLLDRGLDTLIAAGVTRAIVNVHYLGGQVIDHLAMRDDAEFIVSDEREGLLDSGGGIIKALPHLGKEPFFILNADTFWLDNNGAELKKLSAQFDPSKMDILLMLADQQNAIGHSESGDFTLDDSGQLSFAIPPAKATAPIYAGVALVKPEIFVGAKQEPHSFLDYIKTAMKEGKLYGTMMHALWITVGTPDAIDLAEKAVREFHAQS